MDHKHLVDGLVTVEMWQDPKIRKTLNIIDLFEVDDKAQPNDNGGIHKLTPEIPT
jgi:hypothetical protein